MEIEGSDSEKNKGEKNRYSPIIHLNDYERKLLLQCAGKFQLNKYFESLDTIKIEMHEKFIQMSKLFKDFGYARSANTLGHQYLPLKRQAMERMSLFYVKRRGVKPRKVDYIFAYLFPKYFEGLGLDMNELMADAKVYATGLLESLALAEGQEHPTRFEDIASLEHSNEVKSHLNLKRPHSEEAEGPTNKITKEVHEDEDVWLKRMLDITRERNNCEAATSESSANENNYSTDINTLKAKLLDIENEIKKKDHKLEMKNLEISHLNELHAKNLELEKMKFAIQFQIVKNKN